MTRVLFVLNVYPGLGGVETATANLVEALKNDNDIYILAYGGQPGYKLPHGVKKAFYFPCQDREGMPEDNVSLYNRILSDCKITHVVNQGIYPFLTNIVLNPGRDPKVKVISVLHAVPGYEKKDYWCQEHIRKSGIFKKTARRILAWAGIHGGYRKFVRSRQEACRKSVNEGDRVVLLCDHYMDEFMDRYGIGDGREKLCAIPNSLSEYYTSVNVPDMASKENIILYVGRLSAEKNVRLMLQTWRKAQPSLAGWKFVIVGDGPLRGELEAMAVRDKLVNIEFAGAVADPSIYYKKARILLLMSKYEGFPLALMEAQRFGLVPVAYKASSGVASIVGNDGGVLLHSLSINNAAEEIIRLAADSEKLDALGKAAYRLSDRYRIDIVAGKWRNLLK